MFQSRSAGMRMHRVCKSCGLEKPHEYFTKNPRYNFGITYKCKDCFNEEKRQYYRDNRNRILGNQKRSVIKRKAAGKDVNKPSREYSKRNPQYKRFYAAQRRKYARVATPSWLSEDQKADMKAVYDLRDKFSSLCGVDYHVDHIIPLRGDNVCGLNVPWNLQLLEAKLNMAKGNTYST